MDEIKKQPVQGEGQQGGRKRRRKRHGKGHNPNGQNAQVQNAKPLLLRVIPPIAHT